MLVWNGQQVPYERRSTFEEMAGIEEETGRAWTSLRPAEEWAALVTIALRRHGVVITFAEVLRLDPDDLFQAGPIPTLPGEDDGTGGDPTGDGQGPASKTTSTDGSSPSPGSLAFSPVSSGG